MEFPIERVKYLNSLFLSTENKGKLPYPHTKCLNEWEQLYDPIQGLGVHYRHAHPGEIVTSILQQTKDLQYYRQFRLIYMC